MLEGIGLGLVLAIMLGPIFVALTQAAIERGARAGLLVGLGIWISDVLIMGMTYLFVQQIEPLVSSGQFKFWMGLIGGIVLILFGVGTAMRDIKLDQPPAAFTASSVLGYCLKGFLVNTINPFTFIFWISVITTNVIARGLTSGQAQLFLGGILLTIICTDTAKAFLAKLMRERLTPSIVAKASKVAGLGLVVFGLYLIVAGAMAVL